MRAPDVEIPHDVLGQRDRVSARYNVFTFPLEIFLFDTAEIGVRFSPFT